MLLFILIVALIIALIGSVLGWSHGRHGGYYPSVCIGMILLIQVALLISGRP